MMGFLYKSVGKESTCNAGDPSSTPGVRNIPWRRDRQLTPVFLGFACGSAGKESLEVFQSRLFILQLRFKIKDYDANITV